MKENILKQFFLHINELMIDSIRKLTIKKIIVFYLGLFLAGRVISCYKDMELSIVHQINLSIISVIELNILNKFYKIILELLDEFLGRNLYMLFIVKKLKSKIFSIYNILIPTVFCVIFAGIIMFLEYLPKDFMGYFGLFMATSSFFFALVAYYALISSLICFYQLSKLPHSKLLNKHPDDIIEIPSWLKQVINLYGIAKKAVFMVGFLYTVEYLLLVPSASIEFSPTFKINSEYPILFLYNWIIIAVFVIIACPIVMWLFKHFLRIIIENTKKNAVEYINMIWGRTTHDVNSLLSYQQIIKHLSAAEMYQLPRKNLYPVITTSLAFALNIIKLFETYLIPFYGITI